MSPASYSSRTTSTIFMAKTDPDKLAGILAKTWNKMSPSGRDAALKLALPPAIPALLQQGLARFRGNRWADQIEIHGVGAGLL
jgi:hypothetical protein